MSEPLGTPRGGPGVQPAAQSWPESTSDRPPDESVYRPLSLGAIVGFGIAALYAVVLSLVAVAAVLRGTPLLAPLTTLLIPLVAAVISGAAWLLIQRSEGTRAGATLALWGVLLAVGFGMAYAAYYFAKYLVIRDQATSFAREWIDELNHDQIDQAFVKTILPERRPVRDLSPAKLHEWILKSGNPDSGEGRGIYDRFSTMPMIQLLRQARGEAEVQPMGISSWEYKSGIYEVVLYYRVKTAEASWETRVVLVGSESRGSEGRQWNVVISQSAPKDESITFTPFGNAMSEIRENAVNFMKVQWQRKIQSGLWLDAYWDTVEPAERAPLVSRFPAPAILSTLSILPTPWAAVALADPGVYLPEYRTFAAAGYVTLADSFSPANDPAIPPQEILASVRQMIAAARPQLGANLFLDKTPLPWYRENGRLHIPFAIRIELASGYQVSGVATLETDDGPFLAAMEARTSLEPVLRR